MARHLYTTLNERFQVHTEKEPGLGGRRLYVLLDDFDASFEKVFTNYVDAVNYVNSLPAPAPAEEQAPVEEPVAAAEATAPEKKAKKARKPKKKE